MFGKLTLDQRKYLQGLLTNLLKTEQRAQFLTNANLATLIKTLPMEETPQIFAGALVRECERLGCPPSIGEFATVLLALAIRERVGVSSELNKVIEAYSPNHEAKYPFEAKETKAELPDTPYEALESLHEWLEDNYGRNPSDGYGAALFSVMREVQARMNGYKVQL